VNYFSLSALLDAKKIIENANQFEQLLSKGKILQHLMGFSNELMAEKLQIAGDVYRRQEYEKARDIYAYLALLNPYVLPSWMGLAASQMHLKLYSDAVKSYSMASFVKKDDPAPYYLASYPYLQLDQVEDAIKSLVIASEVSKKDHHYQNIEKQSLELIAAIKQNYSLHLRGCS